MDNINLPNENENIPWIYSEFEELFQACSKVWEIAMSIMPEQGTIGIGKTEYFNLCMIAIHAKQMRLFVSNYRLCRSGLGQESLLMIRAMFETFVNLKALNESDNPDEYARLWLMWSVANNERMARNIIERYPSHQTALNNLQKELETEKNKVSTEEWEKFVWKGPSKLTMKKLCCKVGLKDAYDVFYPLSSGSHGYDLSAYAKPLDGKSIQSNLSPSPTCVDSNLASSISALHDTLAILNNRLELHKENEVEELRGIVESIQNKFRLNREKISQSNASS